MINLQLCPVQKPTPGPRQFLSLFFKEFPMKLDIQLLRQSTEILEQLNGDGWKMEPREEGFLYAWHHRVGDNWKARHRLHRLGLLTSPAIRVTFMESAH
jgi:hypothetical protein